MALNKMKLKTDIVNSMKALAQYDGEDGHSQEKAIQKFAEDLSLAIDTYVKAGVVSTTVTGTCPQGPVTGTGKGVIA